MRSVLLCVDGSDFALAAAEYAMALSKLMDAHVDILYASDIKSFEISSISDFGSSVETKPFQEMLSSMSSFEQEKADDLENKFSKLFIKSGLQGKFNFYHKIGTINDIIEGFKKDIIGLDVIVLGKRGESSSTEKNHIGKTLETILHISPCPCFIVPKKYSPIKKILVAYDGSPQVTKAIHFIERNSWMQNYDIHLLSVDPNSETKENIKELENVSSNFVGVKITSVQRRNTKPTETIIKYVDKHKINLLMIGSFNQSIIRHLISGSTTLNLLEMSNIPVMAFP